MNNIKYTNTLGKIYLGDAEISFLNNKMNLSHPLEVSDSWDAVSHFHFFYEIHAVLGADIHYFIGDTEHILTDGSFCIFPPKNSHFSKESYHGIKHYVLQLEIRRSSDFGTGFSEYRYYAELLGSLETDRCFAVSPFMLQCLEKISTLQESAREMSRHKINSLFSVLFTEIGDIVSNEARSGRAHGDVSDSGASENESIKRRLTVEKILQSSYADGISYEDIMRELSLSKRQSIRVVKDLMGMTLNELVVKQRIERSIELMNKTEMSLEEIAFEIGYSSYAGFYIAFKKLCGIPPVQYKKALHHEL